MATADGFRLPPGSMQAAKSPQPVPSLPSMRARRLGPPTVNRLLRPIAAALIGTALIAGTAQAQNPSSAPGAPPAAGTAAEPSQKPKTAKAKQKPQAPLSLTNPSTGKSPPRKAQSSKPVPGQAPAGKPPSGKPPAANPPPRPPGEVGAVPPPAPPSTPQSPPPPAQVQPMTPIIAQPSPPRPGQPPFNAKQIALLERISNYLSNLRSLVGEFKQIAPDGKQSSGDFYLLKPGRVRFDYNPPNPIELIADGRSVVVRDRNLASQDVMAISQTPLRFLLADRIDLLRDTNVVAVYGDNVFSTVVIEERQIVRGTYRVMLMFDARTMELRQWVVTDPQGRDTTVVVYNLDTVTKPDPELFKIDYTRYVR
jgi:outer membrane lipoprotein-sorting protein